MASSKPAVSRSYAEKRDFSVTPEPAGGGGARSAKPIFVVQRHQAKRAGLHYDFRLEHGGTLWSWAVPKGPSLDPADRRMAIHVEDHPIDYAGFSGDIPEGQYGAGHVDVWDHGTWEPLEDADAGMRAGHLRFNLAGEKLRGRFTLARLKGRGRGKADAWFLIKGDDDFAREDGNVTAAPPAIPASARRAKMPEMVAPELCSLVTSAPEGDGWVSEIKLDGYRFLAWIENGAVRLMTRNGLDWADRMPAIAAAIGRIPVKSAIIDGELVAYRPDGVTGFPELQAALKAGRDDRLTFVAFDLLYLDGMDLRGCTLVERKQALAGLDVWRGLLAYSDHQVGAAAAMHAQACAAKLEGIICKRADAPYRSGRGRDWVKLKCGGREEFVVLGWTAPAGSRVGLGALHVGYFDATGLLHYAGGIGTGFDEVELRMLRKRLDTLAAPAPANLQVGGEPIAASIRWVRPEIVVEIRFADWSGAGRIRHGVYLGVREDKKAREVVREIADASVVRAEFRPGRGTVVTPGRRSHVAVPPVARETVMAEPKAGKIVVAKAPKKASVAIEGVEITHADRELWPGISKRDLAEYWLAVASVALPGIARRPLSILRCPEGVEGHEHFFQKNGHGALPHAIREAMAFHQPYLAIDDVSGLVAMAQMSAIEIHTWGAPEALANHPDRMVFDLDPGEGVAWPEVIAAAQDVRGRLEKLGLVSFCRTTGGKGLHVVVPLDGTATWETVKPFCHAFAETMVQEAPAKFVAHVKIADRKKKILVDWLRNGLGATAVASFSPRAREGATVAMPVGWREVGDKLDPRAFTVKTVPGLLAKRKGDPWQGFEGVRQSVPGLPRPSAEKVAEPARSGSSRIVVAKKPR